LAKIHNRIHILRIKLQPDASFSVIFKAWWHDIKIQKEEGGPAMAFSKVATSTFFLAKEYSTILIVRTSRKLLNIKFIRRNQLAIVCALILWVASIVSAFLTYDKVRTEHFANLYQRWASATKEIASTSTQHLLENDTLALSASIRDFSNIKDIQFIAILDHQSKIMAHTNPEMINRSFSDLSQKEEMDNINGISISSGTLQDGKEALLFSKVVIFSGITIGKIHIALSKASSNHTVGQYRLFLLVGIASITVLMALILFFINRIAEAKVLKVQKEAEGMSRIGPYILRKKIGQGGMAELFLADYVGEDGFRKTVAIKKVLPHLLEYPEFAKMFIREARLAALLQHPNIVQVMDFKKIDNASFIAMEYIHGKNLGQLMVKVKDRLPVDLCVFLMLKISSGLHYAHSRKDDATGEPLNIIHRDICPQNLLISYQGEVKLVDFGISKAQSEPSLTQAGVIKGKLSYMAPEQALGKPLNHQADIYSLGVVFYEILTGRKLNKYDSETEAINAVTDKDIPPVKDIETELPTEVNQIVMMCLENDLALRYQSVQELNDALESLKNQYKITYDESNLATFIKTHFEDEENAASEE
jgi:eukaryotic-like serine/threonine-protein kinase